jgi:hypothetical protein
MSIVIVLLVVAVINMIISSDYILAYSHSNKAYIGIGATLVTISKLGLCLRNEYSWKALFITIAVLFIGSILISNSDVSTARIGAIILGLVFLIDVIYTIIYKISWCKSMNIIYLLLNVVGGLVSMFFLMYSATKTN